MKIQELVGIIDSEFGNEPIDELLHRVRRGLDHAIRSVRRPQAALGVVKSPLGNLLVATSAQGIVLNHYLRHGGDLAAKIVKLRWKFDPVEDRSAVTAIGDEICRYLAGEATALHHRADLTLASSSFQTAVLRKLQEVPRGAVVGYQALAAAVGIPGGARAVGNALHDNPVPIYVPCHRVISSSGLIGGYAGGTSCKLKLLRSEGFALDRTRTRMRSRMGSGVVWGHKTSKIYCRTTCGVAARADRARIFFFADSKQARQAGMRPCKICRPA